MSKTVFSVIGIEADVPVYGVSQKSNDKTQAKEMPAPSKKYYETTGKHSSAALSFYVISNH